MGVYSGDGLHQFLVSEVPVSAVDGVLFELHELGFLDSLQQEHQLMVSHGDLLLVPDPLLDLGSEEVVPVVALCK